MKLIERTTYDSQLEANVNEYTDVTLRDLFAAFALAGLIAHEGSPRTVGGLWLAAEAYHAADAMLAQRKES